MDIPVQAKLATAPKVGGLRRGCQGQGDVGVDGGEDPVNYDASADDPQSATPIFPPPPTINMHVLEEIFSLFALV